MSKQFKQGDKNDACLLWKLKQKLCWERCLAREEGGYNWDKEKEFIVSGCRVV